MGERKSVRRMRKEEVRGKSRDGAGEEGKTLRENVCRL